MVSWFNIWNKSIFDFFGQLIGILCCSKSANFAFLGKDWLIFGVSGRGAKRAFRDFWDRLGAKLGKNGDFATLKQENLVRFSIYWFQNLQKSTKLIQF